MEYFKVWFFRFSFALSLLTCVLTLTAAGQTLKELDRRNGFKSIKIGDAFAKYQGAVTFLMKQEKNNSSIYEYTPAIEDLQEVYGTKMTQILLTFDKNGLLVEIYMHKYFGYTNYPDHTPQAIHLTKEFSQHFTALFGKATVVIDNDSPEVRQAGLLWYGSKIYLKSFYDYHGAFTGSDAVIDIASIPFSRDADSGF